MTEEYFSLKKLFFIQFEFSGLLARHLCPEGDSAGGRSTLGRGQAQGRGSKEKRHRGTEIGQ
jgi:hypothetical protein